MLIRHLNVHHHPHQQVWPRQRSILHTAQHTSVNLRAASLYFFVFRWYSADAAFSFAEATLSSCVTSRHEFEPSSPRV